MRAHWNSDWPILNTYPQTHLRRIALPIGGIGTGTVSLGGRGNLRDWEVVNRPAKGFTNDVSAFFALWAKPRGGEAVTRVLEGPIPDDEYEGGFGCATANHSLPRFRHAAFAAAYPFGQVWLADPDVPVIARLEAFNPFIPADADRSGLPVAVLRFVLENRTSKPLDVSVCGTLTNFIGADGTGEFAKMVKGNRNEFRTRGALRGLFLSSKDVDPQAEQWGTLALATDTRGAVTHRTAWAELSWGDAMLDFWDDFSADGRLDPRTQDKAAAPRASLAVRTSIPPRGTRTITFYLAWHFPNRMTWYPVKADEAPATGCGCGNPNRVGNYYTTQFADAWDAVAGVVPELPALEQDTLSFVRSFLDSDLPQCVKEAALNNLSTLRTQTCFRTADGRFFGWEGCGDKSGCCHGTCTHVWNYEQATAFLFGSLSRSMREIEFAQATADNGLMRFRVDLPLGQKSWKVAAADGQMGCVMKLYRDWRLCGDTEMLRALWPKARKTLEFCWIPGGWDADRDGVMEGCQHNTMDVEYYGPNAQMTGWYLGALRAAEEMARVVGEADFAATCRDLFQRGSAWMDAQLFNGEYYEHHIVPAKDEKSIAAGLRHDAGSKVLDKPDLQLGACCLVDQLVGQYMAHVCDLGYLHSPDKIRRTLRAILKYNFKSSFYGHFNHLRTFALNDEAGIVMATYPRGRRPKRPFPYCNELMTGFEYTAAAGMLYEGLIAEGLKVISAVRARYDGRKRSPFDEAECGHHYARAMASWAAVLALTGFDYYAATGEMRFAAASKPAQWFWSTGDAWGTVKRRGRQVELRVLYGGLALSRLVFKGAGAADLGARKPLRAGAVLRVTLGAE